ncbi:hypothetical protein D3C85_840390 [compost metagenome]
MKRFQCTGKGENLVTRQCTSALESTREFAKAHDNQIVTDFGLKLIQLRTGYGWPKGDRKL